MKENTNSFIFREKQTKIFNDSLKIKNVYIVNSMSGSGKTTFFLNFLNSQNKKYIYVPLSKEDIDPINFFEKLTGKIKESSSSANLPKLTIDFFSNIKNFSKNYFEYLTKNENFKFLVLDDIQNIRKSKEIINILQQLIETFSSSNKKLILISKEEINFPYFDWKIENKIFRIDTNFFRFSEKEIKKFFLKKYKKDLTKDEVSNILISTEGIIGKILLVRDTKKTFTSIYESLESKLISIIGENNIRYLCLLFPFPVINDKILKNFNEHKKLVEILDVLYIEDLFVTKTLDEYKFHDILKEYLHLKSKEIFKENYKDSINRLSTILYNAKYIDIAIDLLYEIENFERIVNILEKHIIDFIYEGKLFSVQKYISMIEDTKYMNHPIFLFAKGYLYKFEKPEVAIKYFKQTLNIFQNLNNIDGEKLVIGELFDLAQFYGEDFEVGGTYLKRAEALIKSSNSFSKSDIRLLSYMGIIYLLYEGNSNKSYYYFKILNNVLGKNLKDLPIFFSYIKLYSAITYCTAGKIEEAEEVFKEGLFIYENSNKNPNDIFMFNFLSSMYQLFIGNFNESVERAKEGLKIIDKWKLSRHEEHMLSRLVRGLLCLGNVKEAKKYLNRVSSLIYRTSFSKAVTYQLESQMYLIEKRYDLAMEKAQKSIEIFSKINRY